MQIPTIIRRTAAIALLMFAPVLASRAATPHEERARALLEELVEINTAASAGAGATRTAAEHMARHLLAAGFPREDVQVLETPEGGGVLIARYRAAQPRSPPVLLLAHLDVVEALRSDWSVDPFTFLERDGYFYGRGVWDNKAGASLITATLLRLKEERFAPDRDLVLVFTSDEETEQASIRWLLTEHRPLLDAQYAVNSDGGRVILRHDRIEAVSIETSEKVYATYSFTAVNSGGHSSLPRTDNAIYALARALEQLAASPFPVDLNETTRAYLAEWPLPAADPQLPLARALAQDRLDAPVVATLEDYPYVNALARTTCVATELSGGHAENALPQTAKAVVNCRILPQEKAADVFRRLGDIAAPSGVTVEVTHEAVPSPPSPVKSEFFRVATRVAGELWPDTPVLPQMATGASDSLYLRNAGIPAYTIDFIAMDPDDDRSHGRDERILVRSYYTALDAWYRLLTELAAPARSIAPVVPAQ